MKHRILTVFVFLMVLTVNAQSVKGKLTLNGKTKTAIELKTNSAVQLFKEFKTSKYQLKFNFDGTGLPTNIYEEAIVFFEFKTEIYKNGKLVKNLTRKQPIPYFPGEMFISAEAFDFVGLLAVTTFDDMEKEPGLIGVLSEGKYSVRLSAKPINVKGDISSVDFSFALRTRPGRIKI